jgi:hypothetical protein
VKRYRVVADCLDLAERGYRHRRKGEVVELPDDARAPKWFVLVDPKTGEADLANAPKPTKPDDVANALQAQINEVKKLARGGQQVMVNAKDPTGAARRQAGKGRDKPTDSATDPPPDGGLAATGDFVDGGTQAEAGEALAPGAETDNPDF